MKSDEKSGTSPDISILMPCMNEERTVAHCIEEAKRFIAEHHLAGEIIVVDNGSEDGSVDTARAHGARVIREKRRGYGRAIRTGIRRSCGRVIIIGDCDMTYDFYHLGRIYRPLASDACDVMIGNRLDTIEPGAMPLSHRIGVRFLSQLGRCRYHVRVRDFHCGLRGMTRQAAENLRFRMDGMEFATEMIAVAAGAHMRIGQTRVVLKKCPYGRESKLRTIRDGIRHLAYMLFHKDKSRC